MDKIQKLAEKYAEDHCEIIRDVKEYNNYCDLANGFMAAMELELPIKIKLMNALRHLVILKKWKDKYGKAANYLDQKPKAWDYAIKILNEIDPEDKLNV